MCSEELHPVHHLSHQSWPDIKPCGDRCNSVANLVVPTRFGAYEFPCQKYYQQNHPGDQASYRRLPKRKCFQGHLSIVLFKLISSEQRSSRFLLLLKDTSAKFSISISVSACRMGGWFFLSIGSQTRFYWVDWDTTILYPRFGFPISTSHLRLSKWQGKQLDGHMFQQQDVVAHRIE